MLGGWFCCLYNKLLNGIPYVNPSPFSCVVGVRWGVSIGEKEKITIIDVNMVYSVGLVSEFAFLPDLLLFRFESENF